MTDKQRIEKIVEWLKFNIKELNNGGLDTDFKFYNDERLHQSLG